MVLSKIYTKRVYEAGSHSFLPAFSMIDNLESELVECSQNHTSKKLMYPNVASCLLLFSVWKLI